MKDSKTSKKNHNRLRRAGIGLCLFFVMLLLPICQVRAGIPIPSLRSILADESGSITLKWEKVPSATKYEVAKALKGSKKYRRIASTRGISFRDAKGEPGKTYSYKVRAITAAGMSDFCGDWEKTCRKEPERIAYVGDSVMSGFDVYGVLSDPREYSFAQVSRRMATVNSEDLPSVIAYNPDRVFMMVGTNDCVGNKTDDQIAPMMIDYYDMIDKLHAANPAIEIIVMGISPTRSDKVDNDTVRRFNNHLQKMVGERDFAYYYDTGRLLRDDTGMLKSEYAADDGIHWSKAAYEAVYADLQRYVQSW